MAKRKPKRNPRKIPYVMLLKEFTDLTGDTTQAILLARLENLTRQKQDFDEYVEEEIARAREAGEVEPSMPLTHAWIWKKAEELAEESLLVTAGKPVSGPTIRKHLKAMVERGWLDERRNPKHNWDRTLQYRVNLIALEHDLNAIGHTLPGWTFEDADDSTPDVPNPEPELASANNFALKQEDFASKDENFGAIPDSDAHTPTAPSDPSQEALAVEGTDRRSRNSLSAPQQTRDSDGRRSSQEVANSPSAGERSGTENLKRQEQKPAPRQGNRESDTSSASSAKALAVKDADLSPRARETLEAGLERQAELKGAANVPHSRRRLLALLGTDEAAWISLPSHSTLTARTCVASFAETHATRPAGAGSSLADDAAAKKREINRSGSYVSEYRVTHDRITYVPLDTDPPNDDAPGTVLGAEGGIVHGLAGVLKERARRARRHARFDLLDECCEDVRPTAP